MDIQQVYAELCKKLGDATYKLSLYEQERARLLSEIAKLDEVAKKAAQASEPQDEAKKPETEISST